VEKGIATTLKSESKCWCDDPECCRVVESDSAGVFRFELVALAVLAALYIALLMSISSFLSMLINCI